MLFSGILEIDPSQETVIRETKKNNPVTKFFDALSFGTVSTKFELETFSAVAVLQSIYFCLKDRGIDNIIRLTVDETEFYFDEHGNENDLGKAYNAFIYCIDSARSHSFEKIYLAMEHLLEGIKYLIEITVNRIHEIGEYPIIIKVAGVIEDFEIREGEAVPIFLDRLESRFLLQNDYSLLIYSHKLKFDNFLDGLSEAIENYIKADDIRKIYEIVIIRPQRLYSALPDIPHPKFSNPPYSNYFGFNNFFVYTWFWARLMWKNNIYCNYCTLVDETGKSIVKIGESGFNAGESNTLNPESNFEAPDLNDLIYYKDNEYSEIMK